MATLLEPHKVQPATAGRTYAPTLILARISNLAWRRTTPRHIFQIDWVALFIGQSSYPSNGKTAQQSPKLLLVAAGRSVKL
jgi:hypothetical protein